MLMVLTIIHFIKFLLFIFVSAMFLDKVSNPRRNFARAFDYNSYIYKPL